MAEIVKDEHLLSPVRLFIRHIRGPFISRCSRGADGHICAHLRRPQEEINNLYLWLWIPDFGCELRTAYELLKVHETISCLFGPMEASRLSRRFILIPIIIAVILGLNYQELKKATWLGDGCQKWLCGLPRGLKIFSKYGQRGLCCIFLWSIRFRKSTLTHAKHDHKYDIKVLWRCLRPG